MKIRVLRNETRQDGYKKLYSRVNSYFIVCEVWKDGGANKGNILYMYS